MKKGKGRVVATIGTLVVLAGCAAPSQAAVSAGNILAAPAAIDRLFRQDLRVQMSAADERASTAKPAVETVTPAQPAQTDGQAAANDQLNDVDRSLRAATPPLPRPPVAVASNDAPEQRTVAVAGDDHSVWGETSLIGKVFIAFGTLLTIASAARMFMA